MSTQKDITIILDRSGSMNTIKNSTIEGFNSFLNSQKTIEANSSISLIQFDDQYEINYENKPIKLAEFLSGQTYQPRGLTALLDAIGTTIKSTKRRIKSTPKSSRTKHVVIAVITDGFENASKLFTKHAIFELIRKRETKDNWEFVFIGANQDAIHEASNYGISVDKALTFAADEDGVKDVFESLSKNIYDMDLKKKFEFLKSDRDKQKR